MTHKYLFISYAREDASFAQRINADLRANGIQTWIDEIGIGSGDHWPSRLAEAISNCTAMLLILSPESVQSKWVLRELEFADSKGKPIFPLLLSPCDLPSSVELRIGNIQWASFVQGNYENNFEKLLLPIAESFETEVQYPIKADADAIAGTATRESIQNQPDVGKDSQVPEVKPPAIAKPSNLSFDEPMLGNQPTGWFNSLGFVDRVSLDYDAKIVLRQDQARGLCILLQNTRARADEFGSLMQRVPVSKMAGRVIKLVGELRLEDVQGWAGLWLRADGAEVPNLFFYNMADRRISGTLPWTSYSLDAPLPAETVWLNYGMVLAGPGKLWADNFRILVWDDGYWVDLNDFE